MKQLLNAPEGSSEDSIKIDGVEQMQVTLVGMIMAVSETSAKLTYTIDDGTGSIEVKLWIDTNETEASAAKRAAWKEGVYVRASGHARSFNSIRSIVAFRISAITDFNEVTFHMLDTLNAHLYNTKGALPGDQAEAKPAVSAMAGGMGGMAAPGMAAPGQKFGAYSAVSAPQQTSGGLSTLQDAALKLIRQSAASEGASLDSITRELSSFGSMTDIKQAVEFLSSEGHIYSTIDDVHYKTTD